MDNTRLYRLAEELAGEFMGEFQEINHYLFEHPELGMVEYESSEYLASYMAGKGFRVEKPVCGMETAFLAVYGESGPQIDLLCEYDALPGYGPEKKPAHACGHNWIAASTAGTAVILAELVKRGFLRARIRLVGAPAEETYGGKVVLAREGVFKETTAALQGHLADVTNIVAEVLALNCFEFHFRGRASHAAAAPWDGINALDAVQLTFAGINALRQHIRTDARIHGIVSDGGQAPNIVPDQAGCRFMIRAAHRDYLNGLVEKVLNIARGAALMTGAELTITEPELPLDNVVHVKTLAELCEKHLVEQGIIPTYTWSHQGGSVGSTDVGNVSYVCPTLMLMVKPNACPVHCHEESALAVVDAPAAYETLRQVMLMLADVAIDIASDPEVARQVKRDFAAARGIPYEEPDWGTEAPEAVAEATAEPEASEEVVESPTAQPQETPAEVTAEPEAPAEVTAEPEAPADKRFFTPEDYRGFVLDEMPEVREQAIELLIERIVDAKDLELDEEEIENETDYLLKSNLHHLTYARMAGQPAEEVDVDALQEEIRRDVIREFKTERLLKAVIANEAIEATMEDLAQAAERLAAEENTSLDLVKRFFGEDYSGLAGDVKRRKAKELLYELAVRS